MNMAENLYESYKLKRVYYSAYVPVSNSPKLNGILRAPLIREHRLYQADWLLRFYGFKAKELLDENNPNLNISMDPKADWAIRNIEKFPLEINKASLKSLIRVPGIGLKSAERIIQARTVSGIDYDDLKKLGVVMKRAKYFITCNGKWRGEFSFREALLKDRLSLGFQENMYQQISFF